jgi:hypothetical protein
MSMVTSTDSSQSKLEGIKVFFIESESINEKSIDIVVHEPLIPFLEVEGNTIGASETQTAVGKSKIGSMVDEIWNTTVTGK